LRILSGGIRTMSGFGAFQRDNLSHAFLLGHSRRSSLELFVRGWILLENCPTRKPKGPIQNLGMHERLIDTSARLAYHEARRGSMVPGEGFEPPKA
jgi:hypothetical protein